MQTDFPRKQTVTLATRRKVKKAERLTVRRKTRSRSLLLQIPTLVMMAACPATASWRATVS